MQLTGAQQAQEAIIISCVGELTRIQSAWHASAHTSAGLFIQVADYS